MTQDMVSPWSFYKGWDVYQSHLVKAIEPLTPEQLELRISPTSAQSAYSPSILYARAPVGWLSR